MGFKEDLEQICGKVDGSFAASVMGFDGIPIETHEARAQSGTDLPTLLLEYARLASQARPAAAGVSGERASMADVIDTSEFRNGLKILIDNEPYVIVEFQHVKPGKGSAFVRTRYKSLITGRVLEKNFKSGEKVGRPDIEDKKMQYLYKEGDHYVFMDSKNFEQSHVDDKGLGDSKNFLKENMEASILFWNGRAISVDLPNAV